MGGPTGASASVVNAAFRSASLLALLRLIGIALPGGVGLRGIDGAVRFLFDASGLDCL
jgi:hypothetical protein